MRIFIYEFVTGGGCLEQNEPISGSLLSEGRAMVQAVTADFAAIDGVEIFTTRDTRLPCLHSGTCHVTSTASSAQERAALVELAQMTDWTLLIAPETRGALLDRCEIVE